MEPSNLDEMHIRSFRGSDMAAIEASKAYFDSLSTQPLLFIDRMVILMQKHSITPEEKNLLLFLIKKVIETHVDNMGVKDRSTILDYFWRNTIQKRVKSTSTQIEILVILISKVNSQSLCQYVNALANNFCERYCDSSLTLLLEILKEEAIGKDKIEALRNRNLLVPNWEQGSFSKLNYVTLLIELSSFQSQQTLTLPVVLRMFPYHPEKVSKFIKEKFLMLNCQGNQLIFQYLQDRYFLRKPGGCSEAEIFGITTLIQTLCSTSQNMGTISCELLSTYSQEQIIDTQQKCTSILLSPQRSLSYFNWLVNLYTNYQERVSNQQIEEDRVFINLLDSHLVYLSAAYAYIFILPLSHSIDLLFGQSYIVQSFQISAYYFILSYFTPLIPYSKLPSLASQIMETQKMGFKLPIGFLTFTWKFIQYYLKYMKSKNMCSLFKLVECMKLEDLDFAESEMAVRMYLEFLECSNFDFTQVVFLCDKLPGEVERHRLMELFVEHMKRIEISEYVWDMAMGWTADFNSQPDYIKIVELEILSTLMNFDGDVANFYDLFQHIKTFSISPSLFDVFAQLLTKMLKVYNRNLYSLNDFPQYCERIFILKYKEFDLFELAMEIINLPSENMELLQRFFKMLVNNMDWTNPRLLDIVQVFTIYYPITSAKEGQNILRRLSGKEYFRFYWRLRPSFPPSQQLNFPINDIVPLKWVLLSYIFLFDKTYKNTCSREQQHIESLVYGLDKLSLNNSDNEFWKHLIDTFHSLEDNESHWISGWEKSTVKPTIKRDFEEQSKKRILERHEKVLAEKEAGMFK